jgi:hypothetical protein
MASANPPGAGHLTNSIVAAEGGAPADVAQSSAVRHARSSQAAYRFVAGVLAFAAVGFVFWRAWVCDDAFITFHHVANCLAGYGPVFNVGERVQGFTHPLWFLLLLAGGVVFDVYAFAVTAGLVLTAVTVLALAWLYRGRNHATLVLILTVAVLLGSRTFVEFQTSGLETPLTALLVVLLFAVVLRQVGDLNRPPPVTNTALLCSLLLLTRPDLLTICGPIFVWSVVSLARQRRGKGGDSAILAQRTSSVPSPVGAADSSPGREPRVADASPPQAPEGRQNRPAPSSRTGNSPTENGASPSPPKAPRGARRNGLPPSSRAWLGFLAALVPLVLWYGFATIYYGTPLPNTAYAKVALPLQVAILNGAHYVLDYAGHEPMHAALVACALVGATVWSLRNVARRRPMAAASVCLALGLWLHLIYVIGVGGDFMRGRFLLPVLVGATAMGAFCLQDILPSHRPTSPSNAVLAVVLVAALLPAGLSSLWDMRPRVASQEAIDAAGGISDEHAWYAGGWNENRFRPPERYPNPYTPLWVRVGNLARRYSEAHGPITIMWQAMGILPYHAGPNVRVIDQYGLTDAFVARCPASPNSRVGHIEHEIPMAYLEARGVLGVLSNWGPRMEALDPTLTRDAQAMMRAARWDDPAAFQRWQRVHRMISGDLFSWERLADIPEYALGGW